MKVVWLIALLAMAGGVSGQELFVRRGEPVPVEAEKIYQKGLKWLASTQTSDGSWSASGGYGDNGPGVTGLSVLAILAHGDDPNVGAYAMVVHRGIKNILAQQDARTGYIGNSMYHHGFATLALAEAYGAVAEPGIGAGLQKAVDLILASQKRNPQGAWRYSPEANDADTTVSGAQMVALAAARNAGIGVPEEAIQKALNFFKSCQDAGGGIGYTSVGGPNVARTAIAALVFTLNGQKDSTAYKGTASYLKGAGWRDGKESYLKGAGWRDGNESYPFYMEYYASQAAFHIDERTWAEWNAENIKKMASTQETDGSWSGQMGKTFSTSAGLLSLALNYRFLPIYER
jgi:hypothetical protein